MSLTVENVARDGLNEMYDPNHVMVKVNISWHNGICIPDEDGEEQHFAIFEVLTVGDNFAFEKATTYSVVVGVNPQTREDILTTTINTHEYRRLIVKKKLVEWSLDVPIEKDRFGWLTREGYLRVSSVPAPLLDAFVSGFEEQSGITDVEENKIERQCAVLFSKHSKGVSNACEAISLFCNYGSFSEKFGSSPEDLMNMSYREFLLLKIVMSKESDSIRASSKSASGSSKVAGRGMGGGKTQRIPMPGSGGIQ